MNKTNKKPENPYQGGLGKYAKRYIPFGMSLVVYGISAAMRVCAMYMTSRSGPLIDAATSGQDLTPIVFTILIAFGIRLAICVPDFVLRYRYREKMRLQSRSDAANAVARAKVTALEGLHSGDAANRLAGDLDDIAGVMGWSLINYSSNFIFVAGIFVYGLTVNLRLTLVTIATVIPCMLMTHWVAKPMQKLNKARREAESANSQMATDIMGGIEAVKSLGVEQSMLERMDGRLNAYVKAAIKETFAGVAMRGASLYLGLVPLLASVITGIALVVRGEITAGSAFAFSSLVLTQLLSVVSNFGEIMTALRRARVAADRVMAVIDMPQESGSGESAPLGGDLAVLDNVSFGYEGKPDVLHSVSLRVGAGERVALVGESGCGKSTVIKLIQGFYAPGEGDVRIMGRSVKDWLPDAMRKRVSIVPQDLFLFPASLRDNLLDGNPDATDAQLSAAMDAGALTPALTDIGGLDVNVGERGGRLSGGQRQRATLTRALLHGAPLLLLDEPTSALDANTENDVQNALDSLGRDIAVLTVAHRLRTVRDADRIYVMDAGRIVQTGRHAQLIAQDGPYRRLFLSQTEGGDAHAS